jgi:predicted permease
MVMLDPGIRTTRLMMFEFDPTMVGYSRDRTASFYRQLIDRTRALPGVKNATLSRAFPFRPNFNDESIVPEGFQMPAGQTAISIPTNVVDEQYFDTVGTPLLQGRAFTTADSADSRAVAVVNAEFAKRYWPGQEPIGKRLRLGANGRYVEVVGVARTAKYLSLAETPQPYLYLPLSQNPRARRMLLVQTEGASGPIMDPVLKTIHEIEPDQPVFNVRTIENYYEQGVLGPALVLIQMVGATGLIGLTLTVVGLYGLIAYSVSRRTREIGVRMALGADRLHVLRLVLRQGITLAAIGVAVGMAISVPVFRLLSSRLSGLGELSLWTLVMVPAGLILVAVCACLMPARHASGIDPTQALRSD